MGSTSRDISPSLDFWASRAADLGLLKGERLGRRAGLRTLGRDGLRDELREGRGREGLWELLRSRGGRRPFSLTELTE